MRFAALTLSGLLLATPAAAKHRLEAAPQMYSLAGATRLQVEFAVGELSIEGHDGKDVRVLVQVRCRRGSLEHCEDRARRITIDHRVTGDRLKLKFEGIPKHNWDGLTIMAHILVPRGLATHVHMGVGELEVREMAGPLDLDLGVGELDVRLNEKSYRSALVATGIGDASIRTGSGRTRDRGFLGHCARWNDGAGAHTIDAHVGVGEASIQLD